ncbi:MAG: FimB/Mfa2 family fimbrial subunit [Bacteroides sp.]|nr:FimB/Mfa2 family fimbrial subunit [Bacteroides sp.]
MLWYLLLVVTGCNIKEDLSDCPPAGSYQIWFRYYAGGTTDIFNRRIESVRTYIFDKEGEYITQQLSLPDRNWKLFKELPRIWSLVIMK